MRARLLGLVAVAYGGLNLLVTLAPSGALGLPSPFLTAGLLKTLDGMIPAELRIGLSVLVSLPFVLGGIGLLTGKRGGRRTIAIAAGLLSVFLVVVFFLYLIAVYPLALVVDNILWRLDPRG